MSVEVQAALNALAQSQLSQMARELAEIQVLSRRLDRAPGPILEQLLAACHRLAGSSLTYGHQEFGSRLQRIEQGLDALRLSAGTQGSNVQVASIVRELQGLQAPTRIAERQSIAARSATAGAQSTGPLSKACIVDPNGWIDGDLDRMLSALGIQVTRLDAADDTPTDLLIEVDPTYELPPAPAQGRSDPVRIAVASCDSLPCRLAAVRRRAAAYFALPLDLLAFERRLELLQQDPRSQHYRALLVDDDALLLQRYRAVLESAGVRVFTLDAPEQLLRKLEDCRPDVLVLDVHMPGCSGLELAQAVRYSDAWLQMPILYLSSERSARQKIEALATAGEDFISKPVSDAALVANVVARARRARAIGQGLSRDGLTGLLRHADCKEHLTVALARAQREQTPLVVAMLDLDHFKQVNDRYGHLEGDRVLRAISSLLRARLRGGDVAGRYGGEEFLLVLPDCTLESARELVDSIREEFSAQRFGTAIAPLHCSFSAGLESARAGLGMDELLHQADELLYKAKNAGRGRSVCAEN